MKYRRRILASEAQEKRNLAMVRRGLTRKINANFSGQDYFVLLTHEDIVSYEQAKRERKNFFDRLNRYRKRNGFSDLKYIAVIEGQGQVHHHIGMNAFDGLTLKEAQEILQELWGKGLISLKQLYENQPDNSLASYLTKENAAWADDGLVDAVERCRTESRRQVERRKEGEGMKYQVCEHCGAHLDHGEKCDCGAE